MLSVVAAQLLKLLATAAIVGVVAAGIVLALVWVTSLRSRVFRYVLQAYLTTLRTTHYDSDGLRPRPARLRLQVREEAETLLDDPTRSAVERDPMILADIEGEGRERLIADLRRIWPRADALWRKSLLLITLAVAVGFMLLAPSDLVPAFTFIPDHAIASVVLFGLAGLMAWGLLLTWESRSLLPGIGAARIRLPPENHDIAAKRDAEDRAKFLAEQAEIGGPEQVVRALHLSSGGFDTIMHLGVAHALWVIQGRAPDAIVGVSAGAIQGVAIAEVLQASETGERDFVRGHLNLPPDTPVDWTLLEQDQLAELQKGCLLARAHRLRHFVEAVQRAPERLIDVLIPDTYQIDTGVPVQPLQGPRFPFEERRQRVAQLQSVSGLTRLYNDLLGVSFSIGTLTRFARRVLGFVAAGDLRDRRVWFLVRSVECLRMGLLVGLHLIDVSRLLPILLRAFRKPKFPSPQTAGVLLFQSMAMQKAVDLVLYGFSFAALLLVWAIVSDVAIIGYVLVIAGLLLSLWREPDSVVLQSATVDAARGFLWFSAVATFWTLAGVLMVFVLGGVFTEVWRLITLGPTHRIAYEWARPDVWMTIKWAIAILLALVLGAGVAIYTAWHAPQRLSNRLLASYDLGNSILTEHGLRAFLVEMFDYSYYARASMDRVVDEALKRRTHAPSVTAADRAAHKTVGYYSEKKRLQPIHLGLAVADTATGRLEVVPRATALVDGLLATTAVVPWMPAVELDSPRDEKGRRRRTLFIDGVNVSREPTRALLKMLRGRLNEGSKVVHIYSVTPFPVSRSNLGALRPEASGGAHTSAASHAEPKLWLNLVEIAWRALRLQRFRDATLERRLTEIFSEMIPNGSVDALTTSGKTLRMFRAWVAPVELEFDADVNRRILGATKDDRRRIMYETIADGCRASLQVMIAREIREEAARQPWTGDPNAAEPGARRPPETVKCSLAVARHLANAPISDPLKTIQLVGSDPAFGPGLSEICRHCCLYRGTPGALAQTLLSGNWSELGPSWPHERAINSEADVGSDERFKARAVTPSPREEIVEAMRAAQQLGRMVWPRNRTDPAPPTADPHRPTVSLLFSGGVFRGVYQMGVLNALHELGIRPDLIAGASVGSITAAMVADAFARATPIEQKARIARLASVYLTIDRLVMTDRLADFVRNFTLRAADTRFSIREADRLFRRYDAPKWAEFDRNARHVIAGLERLIYVSPYELNRLVQAFRGRDTAATANCLHQVAQQYLDRMQIGDEALGAEALERLIAEYVIGDRKTQNPAGFTIDELRTQSGVQFLATATNLTHGRLDVFGEKPAPDAGSSSVLKEVLLASSAFPAVFRPRWSWEAQPGDGSPVQYIDGGVTDNLPLDAVTQFLERAAASGLVPGKPAAPHLVIAASLEVNAPQYILEFTRRQLKQSWIVLSKRAKSLGYNRKLDTYADAQDRMRSVASQLTREQIQALSFQPVHLKVVAIKPNWLCGTFAFHPMLGFERTQQARSIAHGCAGTLMRFAIMKQDAAQAAWLGSWNFRLEDLPQVTDWSRAFEQRRSPDQNVNGDCWLRPGKACPFSAVTLHRMNAKLRAQDAAGRPPAMNCGEISEVMIQGLDEIYRVCPQRKTHLRKI